MSKIFKILTVILLTTIVSLDINVSFSQEKETTPAVSVVQDFFQAPEKFDRVDRNKNKILDDLEGLIEPAAVQDRFNTIVLLNSSLEVLPTLKQRHGEFIKTFTYPAINGFAAELSKGQIIALAADSDVKIVEFDAPVYPHLNTAQQWYGTTQARTDFGVDGNADGSATYSKDDVVIAILDTGLDPNHVDLDGGKIIAWRDATINNDQSGPYDELGNCVGHGTHVGTTAAGEGDGNPAFKGVAPGAALVGVKVLSLRRVMGQFICTAATSEILSGVQWIITNKATYGIDVANMSLGISGCSDGTDSLSTIVNSAVSAGIVMTVSAGNEGPGTCTIGSPAAAANAITVGAMSDVTPMSTSVNFGSCGAAPYRGFYLICFSSRGLTADNRLKPDIASPGVFINAGAAGTTNGYKELSGTSMASPFTAGVAALILDANSALTPAQVKSTIETTAFNWAQAGKDIDYGSGRLQAYEAIKSAGSFFGTGPAVPSHIFISGSLTGTGDSDTYDINVTDATLPIAVTMIIPNWSGGSPDFDVAFYDSSNNPLYSCSGGPNATSPCTCTIDANGICKSRRVVRQETIGFQPSIGGIYKVKVDSFSGSGDYFFDVSFGEAAVSIRMITDRLTEFGILQLGQTRDTTAADLNDVQAVQVDAGPANLDIRSSNFSDGGNTWTLAATNGSEQVLWEFSANNGSTWNVFTVADTLYDLANNVATSNTQDFYLRLTMPSDTASANQHSATVTIVATAAP